MGESLPLILFSIGERSDSASRDPSEPWYTFLDRCNWPSVGRVRDFWEGWFADFPEGPKKRELVNGLQSPDNLVHLAYAAELFTFSVLRQAGFHTELEPLGARRARVLDFLAMRDDLTFMVECKVTSSPREQAKRLREALDEKASRYGTLPYPLLIVTGFLGHQWERDVDDALLGSRVWNINFEDRQVSEARRWNGVLYNTKGPRNVTMSAHLTGEVNLLHFMLPDRHFWMTHHAYPRLPLRRELLPFCRERYFDDEGRGVDVSPTCTMNEFFGMPADWPHFDLDPEK